MTLSSSVSMTPSLAIIQICDALSIDMSSKLPRNKESPSLTIRLVFSLCLTSFVKNSDLSSADMYSFDLSERITMLCLKPLSIKL